MTRPLMLAGLFGAAVGVPYAIEHPEKWKPYLPGQTTSQPVSPTSQTMTGDLAATPTATLPTLDGPGSRLYSSPAPLEGIPTYSLAKVLRMDITKEWVYRRWARKSTGLAEPELFGVRVPLVSGTRMTDVAGSLTYYFDLHGKVDRILLTGQTADTTELVSLLTRRYGFQPQTPQLAGEQLFQVKHKGRVASELRTWPESVLWTTSPHSSFSLELEINRPGSGRFIERPLPELAGAGQQQPTASLFGPPQTTGKPVFPGERIVPTGSPQKPKATPASAKKQTTPVKKLPPPALRWPG